MIVPVQSFTIYHSPNAYLGTVLLRRALGAVPGATLLRRPGEPERRVMVSAISTGPQWR